MMDRYIARKINYQRNMAARYGYDLDVRVNKTTTNLSLISLFIMIACAVTLLLKIALA